jgi:DENN (AEX-3) domain
MFVSCIPMPLPGGRRFCVYLSPLEDDNSSNSNSALTANTSSSSINGSSSLHSTTATTAAAAGSSSAHNSGSSSAHNSGSSSSHQHSTQQQLQALQAAGEGRSRLKPLELLMPPYPWLPLMDIDFGAPFRCLSVPCVLAVFCLMLQEAKILFISSRAELLTQVLCT